MRSLCRHSTAARRHRRDRRSAGGAGDRMAGRPKTVPQEVLRKQEDLAGRLTGFEIFVGLAGFGERIASADPDLERALSDQLEDLSSAVPEQLRRACMRL